LKCYCDIANPNGLFFDMKMYFEPFIIKASHTKINYLKDCIMEYISYWKEVIGDDNKIEGNTEVENRDVINDQMKNITESLQN
jgi:hypothetical protein